MIISIVSIGQLLLDICDNDDDDDNNANDNADDDDGKYALSSHWQKTETVGIFPVPTHTYCLKSVPMAPTNVELMETVSIGMSICL